MKTTYDLFILFLLGSLLCGCASVKRDATTSHQTTEQRDSVVSKSTSKLEFSTNNYLKEKKTSEDILEEITTITLDPITGAIQSVQTARRSTRRNELEDSTERSTDASISESKDSTSLHSASKSDFKEIVKQTTDSRPVQGLEWAWIVGVVVVVLTLIFFIKRKLF